MQVNEIFYSLQGEGKYAGMPMVFIRTVGCNLRCTFCDTKYAYSHGKKYSIDALLSETKKYSCDRICVTGGEPLIQKDIYETCTRLNKYYSLIIIETNGSLPIKPFCNTSMMISLDIKCPSSGMADKMYYENISVLRHSDQLKFIISDEDDYIYAKKILNKYPPHTTVFMQPVWGFSPQKLAEWILQDNLNVYLGVQLHKILWGDKPGT